MTSDFVSPVVTFRSRLLGFDKEEVRAFVRNLIADYDDARKQIERLTAGLEATQTSGGQPRQPTTGVQIERVLASAHKVAEDVRADAEKVARQMVREAQEEAAQLRTNAEADASALTQTAAARAAGLESEIQDLLDRRRVVQAMLDRAADRLNDLARDLRQSAVSSGSSTQDASRPRVSAII